MTPLKLAENRLGEIAIRLTELAGVDDLTEEHRSELATLRAETAELETKAIALRTAEGIQTPIEHRDGGEGREFRQLVEDADFGKYVAAALGNRGVTDGAEHELNQALGIAERRFPLRLLAGNRIEERAAIDGDAQGNQQTWLDRLFSTTAAGAVGISFRPVAAGVAAFPVTTAGGDSAQRGRNEAATEGTYTVAVTEVKPARRAVHGIYSIEDDARLPGLGDAIERDMRMAMTEGVDLAVFKGDAGANENTADITGMQTASISEITLTQANKVDAFDTIEKFAGLIDGKFAMSPADLMVVASVGANQLWMATQANSNRNETVAQIMMGNGITWATRGGIDTNTANGDFGAYVGLGRGIDGAGIAAVWEDGQLITDPYSGAKEGAVQLTLNYLWQLAFPRTGNFRRLKFVT